MYFGLLLNCDWYQPFSHSTYSVGVLYAAIQNLPRHIRFKSENIYIIGIIPGPHEPSLTIASYLQPLVDDLKKLFDGVEVEINGEREKIYAVLTCISCDQPASRKVTGFVGHNTLHGCPRCLKSFPLQSFGQKPYYGGFKLENWEIRCNALHYWYATKHRLSKTAEERKSIEREQGVSYSSLVELPYLDSIRCNAITLCTFNF